MYKLYKNTDNSFSFGYNGAILFKDKETKIRERMWFFGLEEDEIDVAFEQVKKEGMSFADFGINGIFIFAA